MTHSNFAVRLISYRLLPFVLLAILANGTVFANYPSQLTAKWVPGQSTGSRCELKWISGNPDCRIQRLVTSVEFNATPSSWSTVNDLPVQRDPLTNICTFTDHNLPTTWSAIRRHFYYRVTIKTGTVLSSLGPAEVSLVGNHTLGETSTEKDSDADGIPDHIENQTSLGTTTLNPFDFTDGSGDMDGDGVPNAWEFNILGASAMTNPSQTPAPHFTVGSASVSEFSTPESTPPVIFPNTATISAAVNAANPTTQTTPYRIIRVSPGIYTENIAYVATSIAQRNIAILPARGPKVKDLTMAGVTHKAFNPRNQRFEIRGSHATNPVISVTSGTLVLDGFVLSRSSATTGSMVSSNISGEPFAKMYVTRLVNCLIANNNTGSEPVIENHRSNFVLSHCTLFMNGAGSGAAASAYGRPASASLAGTSKIRFHNSILWNPVNVNIPEVESFGDIAHVNTIMNYRGFELQPGLPERPTPPGAIVTTPMFTNPILTPKGYLVGKTAATPPVSNPLTGAYVQGQSQGAMELGKANLHVIRDIHGELRDSDLPDVGCHHWDDDDLDGIPNFSDTLMMEDVVASMPGATQREFEDAAWANAFLDLDFDGISELGEYRYATDIKNADTYFLSLHQAVRMFLPIDTSFYSRAESDALFYSKAATDSIFLTKTEAQSVYRKRSDIIRVQPGGDIGMGPYSQGTPP